jgi:hypothetical protein
VLGSQRETFNLLLLCFLFYLITDRDSVTLPSINVRTSTPPKDEVAVVRPPDRNSDTRGQVLVAMMIQLPSPDPAAARSGHRSDHTTAAPIRPQLCRSATVGATGTRVAPGAAQSQEPWGHVAPPELPCGGRRVLEPRRHVVPLELL